MPRPRGGHLSSSRSATFTYEDVERVWLVEFPALVGCHTFGETLYEARLHAREALQLWLDVDDVEVEEDIRPHRAPPG